MSRPVSRRVQEIPHDLKERLKLVPFLADDRVIFDPRGRATEAGSAPKQLATRKGSPLAGSIALLDISKPGGSILLDRVAALLKDMFPALRVERLCKSSFSRPCSSSLRSEIVANCQYVVEALAD